MPTASPSDLLDKAAPRLRDPLLQPFRLKGLSLRNRIMSTSHAATIDEGGLPKERYQRYHEEKAKGGIALTMFGGSSMVARDSSWGGGQIDMSSDAIIPDLKDFSSRIHGHGAAIMCQISHLGRRATSAAINWLPTQAATASPAPRPLPARAAIATSRARWTATTSTASSPTTPLLPCVARRAGSTAARP